MNKSIVMSHAMTEIKVKIYNTTKEESSFHLFTDMILKKFTIIYGNVKSFDLLMRDFYRADQGEDETIPAFPLE